MAGVLQHLRSSTLDKRPNPASMVDGQVAINYASGSPGMFFKDSNGSLVKVGPVHVGSGAPNAVPASGGTAGNSIGEQWLDTSGGTYVFKIWDGAAWRSEAGEFVNATGDTMTGDLVMNNANLVFEGSVDDGFETTLTVVNPTADRTITLPNVTGTVVTTGDSGTVTSTMIADGTIVNGDVNASAAIAGTKISPNFGSQTIQTTGIISAAGGSAAAPSIAFTGDTNTGIYSPGADQVAISTNGTGRLFIDASGNVGINGAPSTTANGFGYRNFELKGASTDRTGLLRFTDSAGTTAGTLLCNEVTGFQFAQDLARPITFFINNTERMRLDSSGRLGLGTSSPSANCHVNNTGTGADELVLLATASNITFGNKATFRLGKQTGASNESVSFTYNYDATTSNLSIHHFGDSYGSALNINKGGRVGIGTTSASGLLHCYSGTAANSVYINTATSAGYDATLYLNAGTSGGETILNLGYGADPDYAQIKRGSDNSLRFQNNNAERARIDSSGRLLIGTSTARSNYSAYGAALLQAEGANNDGARAFSFTYGKADAGDPIISLGKHRSNSVGGVTVVNDGDGIGQVVFAGSDGTNFVTGATIRAQVDGTPGANDMPGRLVFSTTADGASSPTERARITSGGYFKASNTGAYNSTTASYHEHYQTSAGDANTNFICSSASYTGGGVQVSSATAAGTGFSYYRGYSSGFSDTEFNLRGDGTGLCDGSWTGGGADYAEYFEWSDGNPDAEDRRGISVVLDGDKIRPAIAGEDPIGVISGNPSVVGDSAWNKWNGKYLRDEFGTYIQEDYEVEDENGNTVIQQRRKLNPAYDPDVEYISREERPEWDCVGLMGKLRIRKGQLTGSRWIKMRDISDSVEEWLVR